MGQGGKPVHLPAPPELPGDLVECPDLQGAVERALARREDALGMRFQDAALQEVQGGGVEFSGCVFQRCRFQGNDIQRLCLVDCVLDHCDLSNETFLRPSFQRVRLEHCRMTGIAFSEAALMNLEITNCQMDFAALAETKLNRAALRHCRLRESAWDHVTLTHLLLEDCDLTQTQWRYTPLKGIDLRGCEISGWGIDIPDLQGAKVTTVQALELCRLLRLEIVE